MTRGDQRSTQASRQAYHTPAPDPTAPSYLPRHVQQTLNPPQPSPTTTPLAFHPTLFSRGNITHLKAQTTPRTTRSPALKDHKSLGGSCLHSCAAYGTTFYPPPSPPAARRRLHAPVNTLRWAVATPLHLYSKPPHTCSCWPNQDVQLLFPRQIMKHADTYAPTRTQH